MFMVVARGIMSPEQEQAIRARAYAIWEEEGRPDGKDVEHWLRAESEITSARDNVAAQAGAARDRAPRAPRSTAI
jgi:hypothetical protein